MKKAFLSIAIFALATIFISAFAVDQFSHQDDGFITVKLEELNDNVQKSISNLNQTFNVDSVKFNAEKQITQVSVTGKEDQINKTIYFNQQGEEIEFDKDKADEDDTKFRLEGIEPPFVDSFNSVNQTNDGFKVVKFDDLNENVQKAISALINTYELNALEYNEEKQLTKVTATGKENQTQVVLYFDNDGKEVNVPAEDAPVKGDIEISIS